MLIETAGNEYERWLDVQPLSNHTAKCADGVVWIDMSWPEVHSADHGFASGDCQRSKVAVMSQDNAIRRNSEPDKINIRCANQVAIPQSLDITSLFTQKKNHIVVDVLVREKLEIEQIHPATFVLRMTSFFRSHAA